MASISADTGQLFSDSEVVRGDDLRQSVEDRLFTPVGTRRTRPTFGSVLSGAYPEESEVSQSVRDALASDSRIENVVFRSEPSSQALVITINGRIEVSLNG